ncbi:MAG: ribonuclease HII [Candidatus Saccharibacteria bacterium]|nr:ribonuclease HII [Candidatus Saccharibacteria bacterium]
MAILGIDEVGRGPLAGPLVVGAVILPEFAIGGDGVMLSGPEWILELRDSKKLTAKKRERLAEIIRREAPASGLGWVSPVEIDELGMTDALRLATRRAVKSVQRLHTEFSQIVIDGKVNFLSLTPLEKYVTTVVKADDLVKEVSAASIIAKVARDRYMCEIAKQYPEYGFEKHMGYGTALHREALKKYGPSPEHRKSFEPIKSLVGFERPEKGTKKNTTKVGQQGETAVCEYLVREGHEIVFRNFKTYYCEIDIVSVKGDAIFFTEVKTRKNHLAGGGLMAIDKKKLGKMKFAVECFLKYYPDRFRDLNPLLGVASVDGGFAVEDWVVVR